MADENCASVTRGRTQKPPLKDTMIGELGEDMLVEILIRLPSHRFVSRCKPVCKRWRSLICSPCFNRRFVSHRCTNQSPMPDNPIDLQSTIVSFLPPMPVAAAETLRVLDCFKDLVLCGFWDLGSDNKELCRSYLVCNPFTKQWVALPLAPEREMGYICQNTRFVFEPRISYDLNLGEGEGDGQHRIVCSEYRFRVVCIYRHVRSMKLDLFCSEFGEWTKEALVLPDKIRHASRRVVSCNGELFWPYIESCAAFDPFRPDTPPTPIDANSVFEHGRCDISVSQGVVHLVGFQSSTKFVVWRLEEDRKTWRKQGELKPPENCNIEVRACRLPFLHPHKPETIFFHYHSAGKHAIVTGDLRTGGLEFFAECGEAYDRSRVMVFKPTVSCLPTPISRYEELLGTYDGSYSFWVQSSNTSTTNLPQ